MQDNKRTSSNKSFNNNQQNSFASLPNQYLVGGYFEKNSKTLKRGYVLQFAKELANSLASDRKAIKKTQLRGFYDKVKSARDRVESNLIGLDDALFSVCELAPLAQQSFSRGNAPKLFVDFIDKNVNLVVDYDSLKAFEQHFRAIVCYYPESKK